jgi:DNA-binding NarL/FixJ family response regulator
MIERDYSFIDPSALDKRIRVALVVPHPAQCTRLIRLLSTCKELDVVAVAANCQNAMRLCPHVRPDVVVVDCRRTDVDGQAVAGLIQGRWPRLQVVVLPEGLQAFETASAEGAHGAIPEADAVESANLGATIRSLHAQRNGGPGWNGSGPGLRAFPDQALSRREWEVWQALKTGLTDAQIGEQLAVNELTARLYVRNVLDRLGLVSRRGLVAAERREPPPYRRTRAAARTPERRDLAMVALPGIRDSKSRKMRCPAGFRGKYD